MSGKWKHYITGFISHVALYLALLLRNVDAGAGSDSGALALVDGVADILELRPALLLQLGAALLVILQVGHGLDDVATGGVRHSVALLLRGSHTLLLGIELRAAFLLECSRALPDKVQI